jgi:cytidylate kinase
MSGQRVVAIDGPSASGKSTTARQVAGALGLVHLNSGLLYRAITWVALRDAWRSDSDWTAGLASLRIFLEPHSPDFALRIDGFPAGASLDAAELNSRVSAVAARPDVRQTVLEVIHASVSDAGAVIDGRDIGTAVFPDATLKVFLTASPDERARRRLAEQPREVDDAAVSEEIARLGERDHLDATRQLAPLVRAGDAVELDTTNLSPKEVVARIVALWEQRTSPAG